MKTFTVWRDEDKCRDVQVYRARDQATLLCYMRKTLKGDYQELPDEVLESMIESLYIEEVTPITV